MKKHDLEKEKNLLTRAQSNKTNYSELYQYFLNDVYRFSFSITGNQHDAEDITSQTFIELFNKLDRFEWKGISMKYWLFTTSRNLAYKNFSKEKRSFNPESFDGYDEAKDPGFENIVLDKDELDLVVNEIQDLKPSEREVINMRVWEDMSFEEISKITGEKSITIRQRFYRSVDKLRTSLSNKNYKRFASLGAAMGALSNAGSASALTANSAIAASIAQSINILIPTTIMTTTTLGGLITGIQTFVTTHSATAAIIGATVIAATVSGGYYAYENTRESQDQAVQVSPTPIVTASPTSTITQPTVTNTPTQISTPSPTASPTQAQIKSLTYSDQSIGFKFLYPETAKISIGRIEEDAPNSIFYKEIIISYNGSILNLNYSTAAIGCTAFTPQKTPVRVVLGSSIQGQYIASTFENGKHMYGDYSTFTPGEGHFTFCERKDFLRFRRNDSDKGYILSSLILNKQEDLRIFDDIIKSIQRI